MFKSPSTAVPEENPKMLFYCETPEIFSGGQNYNQLSIGIGGD